MPWNGSGIAQVTDGTFTGTAIWTAEKNAANLVTAAHFDSFSSDLCSMLQNCYTLDGQTIGNVLAIAATTSSAIGVIKIGTAVAVQMKGTANFFAGNAGNFSFTGTGENVGIGDSALQALTNGVQNVCVGRYAGQSSTTAADNAYIGYQAGLYNTTGFQNVGIGYQALVGQSLVSPLTGNSNVAVGAGAMSQATTGGSNVAIGLSAGANLTTGSNNTAIGNVSLVSASANGQININCTIFGTGCTTTGAVAGTGKIGINTNAPTYELEAGKGSVAIATAGQGFRVKEGSNAKQGTATLTAGTVVISNTSVTANSRIILTAQDNNSTGALRVSARIASTSFTITSSNAGDSGVVAYQIFEPY